MKKCICFICCQTVQAPYKASVFFSFFLLRRDEWTLIQTSWDMTVESSGRQGGKWELYLSRTLEGKISHDLSNIQYFFVFLNVLSKHAVHCLGLQFSNIGIEWRESTNKMQRRALQCAYVKIQQNQIYQHQKKQKYNVWKQSQAASYMKQHSCNLYEILL